MMTLLIVSDNNLDSFERAKLFEECDTICGHYFSDAVCVMGTSNLALSYAKSRGYEYQGSYLKTYNSYTSNKRAWNMQRTLSEFVHKACVIYGNNRDCDVAEAYAHSFGNPVSRFRIAK